MNWERWGGCGEDGFGNIQWSEHLEHKKGRFRGLFCEQF